MKPLHKIALVGIGSTLLYAMLDGAKPMSQADKNAQKAVDEALPDATEEERQYLLTVARGEGYYGLGWKNEGVGSHNWGAIQGTGPAGSFKYGDSHADGSGYQGTFKRYHDDAEGIQDMYSVLFGKPGGPNHHIKVDLSEVVKTGSLHETVYAQHENGYYELSPDLYLTRVSQNYDKLATSLGWERLLG